MDVLVMIITCSFMISTSWIDVIGLPVMTSSRITPKS
jgi:hypothetical protein